MKQRLIVSVPFRGYVVVIARRATSALNMCFRPLSGLCSSNNRVDAWGMDIWDGFRPLSGLCSSNIKGGICYGDTRGVSVPFRGYVVVIGIIMYIHNHVIVSVPFRGYVVVMMIHEIVIAGRPVSVPFRGYVVVIMLVLCGSTATMTVSVPFRGYVVVILSLLPVGATTFLRRFAAQTAAGQYWM